MFLHSFSIKCFCAGLRERKRLSRNMLHDRRYIKEKINRSTYTKRKPVPVALQRRSFRLANPVFPPSTENTQKAGLFFESSQKVGVFFFDSCPIQIIKFNNLFPSETYLSLLTHIRSNPQFCFAFV